MKFLKGMVIAGVVMLVLGLTTVVGLYFYVKPDLPSVETLRDVHLQTPMQVYSKDGQLISQFGEKRRIPVKLEDIPQNLRDAIIATEDTRFYEHFGVDPIGVARAFGNLLVTGHISQGASTITMQLARNFFLSFDQVWMRKIKEAFIAVHIEQLLTKDEILTLYLNKIAFGNRAYGVGAAAQVYYGKPLKDLTLAQLATIAGLPKAPSTLNPIADPAASKARRRVVLLRMLDEKKITRAEFDEAAAAPVTARYHGAEVTMSAPYLAEMVRQAMVDKFGEDEAYSGGYKVYTTVDSHDQAAAQQAVWTNLHDYDERHGYRGPVATLWGPEEQPWSQQAINQYLAKQKAYGAVMPAVVVAVAQQTATVQLPQNQEITLNWRGMRWARPYINEDRQGPAPETASDILHPGEQIYLRQVAGADGTAQWRLAQIPEPSSALVSLHPNDGAVAAVVGGYSFSLSQYNRAIQAERQVGSNIKPLLYSAAFDNGFTLATLVNDAPINQWNPGSGIAWRPKNSPDVYEGPIRLRKALAKSKNVVSVRLIRAIGVDVVADRIADFGIPRERVPENESLSLGSISMTPMEVARAYTAIANGGHLIDPYFIDHVEDAEGNIVVQTQPSFACTACVADDAPYERPLKQAPQVISEQTAFLVAQAMKSTVWGGGSWAHKTGWNGTAWRIQRSDPITDKAGREIMGKTGTTNDVKDTWFSGFVSGLVTTTWVGFDDVSRQLGRTTMNSNLDRSEQAITGSEAGAKTALPGWILYMEEAVQHVETNAIPVPPGVVSVRIDLTSGKLSRRNDYTSRFEFFKAGTQPTEYADSGEDTVIYDEQGSLF